jgi:hypothetical protein
VHSHKALRPSFVAARYQLAGLAQYESLNIVWINQVFDFSRAPRL